MIHIHDLCVAFKNKTILDSVTLHVRPQESVSFIGPSGSGKSVLLKCIADLITPTNGSITTRSNRVSMLFQKNALFDSLTLLENLTLPLIENEGLEMDQAISRSMNLLQEVGLDHAAHLYPDEISGGMQKRLGIARALVVEPEVILYDEPTSGLDPITSRSIAELIKKLSQKNRTTICIVTNDLERAYYLSDRIFFVKNQKVRELGTPEQVKQTLDPDVRQFIFSNALKSHKEIIR